AGGVVDGRFYRLFRNSLLPQRPFPSMFLTLDGSDSPVPVEPDRKAAAGRLGCLGPFATRGRRGSGSPRWDPTDHPRSDDRGGAGVEHVPFGAVYGSEDP